MFWATVRLPITPSARRSSDEKTIRLSMADAGRGHPHGLAVDLDLPGIRAVGAVQQPDELGATRSEEAGDADDLALVHVEVGGLEHAAAADSGRAQHGRAGAVDDPRGHGRDGGELVELAADHLRDQRLAGKVRRGVLADELAVAQDRDAIGDLVHLIEEVAHEQDRDPAVAEVAHDGEELLDLAAVEARCRLVEDQHLRVEHHRAADGDELLDRDGVARQRGAGVDVQAEVVEVARRLAVQRPSSRCRRRRAARGRA